MKNPVIAADSWLIDRIFQPISWWCEVHFNVNNFQLARAVICLTFTYPVVESLNDKHTTLGAFQGLLIFVMLLLSFLREKEVKPGCFNEAREKELMFRVLFIVIALLAVLDLPLLFPHSISERIFEIGWTVTLYLFSCTRLPPEEKERLRKQKSKPADNPA